MNPLCADCLFMEDHDTVKLVDFGVSQMFTKENVVLEKSTGSPAFMAPELLRELPFRSSSPVFRGETELGPSRAQRRTRRTTWTALRVISGLSVRSPSPTAKDRADSSCRRDPLRHGRRTPPLRPRQHRRPHGSHQDPTVRPPSLHPSLPFPPANDPPRRPTESPTPQPSPRPSPPSSAKCSTAPLPPASPPPRCGPTRG